MGCHDEVTTLLGVAMVGVAPPRTTIEGEFAIGAVRDINADLGDNNTIIFGFRIGECRYSDWLGEVRCNDR